MNDLDDDHRTIAHILRWKSGFPVSYREELKTKAGEKAFDEINNELDGFLNKAKAILEKLNERSKQSNTYRGFGQRPRDKIYAKR